MNLSQRDDQGLEEETSEFEEADPAVPRLSRQRFGWNRRLQRRLALRLQTQRRLEEHLINRLPNLGAVGRFLIIWLVLVSLLISGLILQIRALDPYYTALVPAGGGIYTEGLVGQATNFNPIYAATGVDQTIASLVFAGLYRYNQANQLEPVLAEPLQIDETARQYTVTLKPDLKWHDGQPLTIDDVIFTIETIQNPAAQSPLRVNWQGVNLDKVDERTLTISLDASFYPFVDNLTLGVLPRHLLAEIEPAQLRQAAFNYQPVGSGPFVFDTLAALNEGAAGEQEIRIQLDKNPDWPEVLPAARSHFFLNSLHFWVVNSPRRLTELFNQRRLSGAFNLIEADISLGPDAYQVANLNLMDGVYLFFKNSSPALEDRRLRQALAAALDISELLSSLDRTVQRIFGPLLPEHAGYRLGDRLPEHDPETAERLLRVAGWQNRDGGWFKEGRQLRLVLTTQAGSDYEILARNIQQQLARRDIRLELDLRSPENIPFEVLQNHNYGDLLIYGLNLGADADVYPYWHSSQIDSNSTSRLNLAEYRSTAADEALEAGRSRSDSALRRQRYADFQEVWAEDLPALALYRFQLQYYTLKGAAGPADGLLLIGHSGRFYGVHGWAVVQERRPLGE